MSETLIILGWCDCFRDLDLHELVELSVDELTVKLSELRQSRVCELRLPLTRTIPLLGIIGIKWLKVILFFSGFWVVLALTYEFR